MTEVSVNRSVMSEYSKMLEDADEANPNSRAVEMVLGPKVKKLNNMISQYFVHHGLRTADKQFTRESDKINLVDSSTSQNETERLQNDLLKAFSRGEEHRFFEAKEAIFEQLNYFKHDFTFDIDLEVRCRVFFALYYLTPLYSGKGDVERLIAATASRLEDLKSFFNENGGSILKSANLKGFMQIPYISVDNLHQNKLVEKCTSTSFVQDLQSTLVGEMDRLEAFLKSQGRHQTFLVRIYDYYLKKSPNAEQLRE